MWDNMSEDERLSALISRVRKSASTSTTDLGAAGKLLAEQAGEFMVVATKRPGLLPDIRTQMLSAEEAYVSQVLFDQPAFFPVEEGSSLSSDLHTKPTFQGPKFVTKEYRAVYQLTDQAVRESISGDALVNTVVDGGAASLGRDIESVALNGDTTLGATSRQNQQWRGLNGFTAQAATHIVDLGSVPMTDDVLDKLLQALPSQFYFKDKLKFYSSHLAELQYTRYLAARGTPAGDSFRNGQGTPLGYNGTSLKGLQLMDEAHGTANKCTDVYLTDPDNLNLGVRDEIAIEFARNARARITDVIFSAKFDFKIGVDDAFVIGKNLKVKP